VFGDVHGRLTLMLTLAYAWMKHTDRTLSAILQVGDMGAYPDHNKLDSATRRHAKLDSDELGYVDYLTHEGEGAYFLDAPGPPILFNRGNHEDFDYLNRFNCPSTVDPWGRLWFLPDGSILTLTTDERDIHVGAFGGVEPPQEEPRGRGRLARKRHRRTQRAARSLKPKHFDPRRAPFAFLGEPTLDVLLTHAGPARDDLPTGSPTIAGLSERLTPASHFFGHHHAVIGPTVTPYETLLTGLDHLEFDRAGHLKPNAWGILTLGDTPTFEFMTEDNQPWLSAYTRHAYRQLM